MSETIAEMVERLCPEGVEYVRLGDFGEFLKGSGLQKSQLQTEGFPAIHYGQLHTQYHQSASETVSFVSEDVYLKLRKAQKNDVLLATTSEDIEAVGKAVAWLGDEVGLSGDAHIFRSEADARYLSYVFASSDFQWQKQRLVTGTKVMRLSSGSLAKMQIPLPPLEIQQEIVRVLDEYSAAQQELEEQLQAEAEVREMQFIALRNSLLSPDTQWLNKPIAEVAKVCSGKAVNKAFIAANPGDYPVINSGVDPLGHVDVFNVEDQPIGVASRGAGVGQITWTEGKYYRGNLNYGVEVQDDSPVTARFLYHMLNELQPSIQNLCTYDGIPALNRSSLVTLQIPFPSLDEQNVIVKQLDALSHGIEELVAELEAEIAARRTQYETFRDQLLTFPRKEVAA